MKLGLAQIKPRLGDLNQNLQIHLEWISRAKQQQVDLLCFPELSLSGYLLQDLVPQSAIKPSSDSAIFAPLLEASMEMDLVVGFVDEDSRHLFRIASAYLSKGKVLHVHHKVYLPTYGMFDEGRFFAAGNSIRAFDTPWGKIGLLICEDFWHSSPPYLLWLDGADLLIHCSASPGRGLDGQAQLSSNRWVDHVNQAYASLYTVYVAHVNRVGFEDGFNFWGGSTVFDPDGELLVQAPNFEEKLTIIDLDLNQVRRARARLPLLRDERPELTQKELNRILNA